MEKDFKAEFSTPEKVHAICEKMQTIERVRAKDRAWIDGLANGKRPYTPAEVEKLQIQINVNWGGLRKIIQTANSQVNNALIYKDRLFTATSQRGIPEKREEWSEIFTQHANSILRKRKFGKRHTNLLKSRNASVTLHGIGPIMWMKPMRVLGRYIALEDLLIPTDTNVDFSNLGHFAVNIDLTQAEFFDMTHGTSKIKVDKRWNVDMANNILDDLAKPLDNQTPATFADQPEKRIEQFKQNRGFYDSDVASTVKLRFFFFKHPETEKWYRYVILREGTAHQPAGKKFLYDGSDVPFADDINEIMHVQFGDNNLCAPLKYHSVRGLGTILYGPEECNNRILCETVQHTLLNLKTWFKMQGPVDRDRPKFLDLSQFSVVPEGVGVVPQSERHQIDPELIQYVQSQLRQVMSEASTSYVQDIQSQSSVQPETATKTNALVQTANIQVSAMLQSLYEQETSYYEEIVRRLLDKKSDDPIAKEFVSKCKEDGIPDELMVDDNWTINPERVLGGGDQFIATQEANALLSQSQRYDPTSQRKILRKWTITTTRNPAMGELLVPEDPNSASPGVIAAERTFATLMLGVPASVPEGIDRTPYIESMIGMLKSQIEIVASIDNVGTMRDLIGMKTVSDHIQKNIVTLAANPDMKQQVKIYGDELGVLMNALKAFEQRLIEKMQAEQGQNGMDPKLQGQLQADVIKAESKAKISQMSAMQKARQKEIAFHMDQARKNMETMAELSREQQKARQELVNKNLSAALDAFNEMNKPEEPVE